ncbi:MAG: 16S rRNA (adenine(1518)-N(6)/adenine(1519)-N(6))-dimethyltransferase RsmA [Patescibacteria group bacterium]
MRAKKHLGQHFLKSRVIVEKIIGGGDVSSEDIVLEIGPGRGILTEELLCHAKKVVAVEKDPDMISLLSEKFADEIKKGVLVLVAEDILSFDPSAHGLSKGNYKLIANIPYYITGEILRAFLSERTQPERMVLLVQKEVAERIVANNGKESVLSISVKVYGNPKIVLHVPKKFFSPPPDVDSAVLSITNISKKRFENISEKIFFEFVKKGFSQKRKQLAGNLEDLMPKEKTASFLAKRGLPKTARAEELTVDDWEKLTSTSTALNQQ